MGGQLEHKRSCGPQHLTIVLGLPSTLLALFSTKLDVDMQIVCDLDS
jgi:hypothetical protein